MSMPTILVDINQMRQYRVYQRKSLRLIKWRSTSYSPHKPAPLSLKEIYKGREEKACATFKRMRWQETSGEPVCPVCGCLF